jgi:hypothetical protein
MRARTNPVIPPTRRAKSWIWRTLSTAHRTAPEQETPIEAGGSKYQEKRRGKVRLTPAPETTIPNPALPNSHFQDAFRTGCVNFSSIMHLIITPVPGTEL